MHLRHVRHARTRLEARNGALEPRQAVAATEGRMKATTLDLGGRRVLRVLVVTCEADGDVFDRVVIATGWADAPPVPFGPESIVIPAEAIPALVAELQRIHAEASP
jgi:hypothetical protein